MSRWVSILFMPLVVCMGSGCMAVSQTRSVPTKAYFSVGDMWGVAFWNCDAGHGEPKCWQVVEREALGEGR